MALAYGAARRIPNHGTSSSDKIYPDGQRVDDLPTGGSNFDIYSEDIPDVLSTGLTTTVKYCAVYIRNTAAVGNDALTINNISISNNSSGNFMLDNNPGFTFLSNKFNTTLVPGSTTGTNNPSLIALNIGGTNFQVDDGTNQGNMSGIDEPSQRTEYIDGVTKILSDGVPADSYRVFIVALFPNKENVNNLTDDELILDVDGETVTITLQDPPVLGISNFKLFINEPGDLSGIYTQNELTFTHEAHQSDQQTSPNVFNFNYNLPTLVASGLTTIPAEKTLRGTRHNAIFTTFIPREATSVPAENVSLNRDVIGINLHFPQTTLITTNQGQARAFAISDVRNISEGSPNVPAESPREDVGTANIEEVVQLNQRFFVHIKDNGVEADTLEEKSKSHGILAIRYQGNAEGVPEVFVTATGEPQIDFTAAIRYNYNKHYFCHDINDEFTNKFNIDAGSYIVSGVRGDVLAFKVEKNHPISADGGVTTTTSSSSTGSFQVVNALLQFPKEYPNNSIFNVNAKFIVQRSQELMTVVGSPGTVTLSNGNAGDTVTDGGSFKVNAKIGTAFEQIAQANQIGPTYSVPSSTQEFSTIIIPPDIKGGTPSGIPVDSNAIPELDYTTAFTKFLFDLAQVTQGGYTLRQTNKFSATHSSIRIDAIAESFNSEAMLVCFNPAKTKFVGMVNPGSPSSFAGDAGQSPTSNQGSVTAQSFMFPTQSWCSSLNGRAIDIHSKRNQYNSEFNNSLQGVTEYSNLPNPDTFNEFSHEIANRGIDSDSTTTLQHNVTNGVIAYSKNGSNTGSDKSIFFHLGTVDTANTNGNTPYIGQPYNHHTISDATNGSTGYRDLNTAAGSSQAAKFYQHNRTLWLYNPGGKAIRVVGIKLDHFLYKEGGAKAGKWGVVKDTTGGGSDVNPNNIFKDTGTAGSNAATANVVSSPIKVVVADVGASATDVTENNMEDVAIYVQPSVVDLGVTTMQAPGVIGPSHEFRQMQTLTQNYSTASKDAVMVGNRTGAETPKALGIQCFFDHIFVNNSDLIADPLDGSANINIASGAQANGSQYAANLEIEYVTDEEIASKSSVSDRGATNVIGDLRNTAGNALDSKFNTEKISVMLSMNFSSSAGTLSITDEDGDTVTTGDRIDFTRRG